MTATELAVLTNLSSILVFYTFMKSVLRRKAEKPYHYILIVVLYVLNVLAVIYLQTQFKIFAIIGLFTGFTMLIFKVSFKKSIIANLIYHAIVLSLEMIALLIMTHVTGYGLSDIPNNDAFIGELSCQLVMFLIVI